MFRPTRRFHEPGRRDDRSGVTAALLLAAIALVLIVAITRRGRQLPGQRGARAADGRVDRGTVALAVSASGLHRPGRQQSLGFADGGTVTQVMVNVGDRVAARPDARPDRRHRRPPDPRAAPGHARPAARDAGQAPRRHHRRAGAGDAEPGPRRRAGDPQAGGRDERVEPVGDVQARTQLRFDESSLNRAEDQLGPTGRRATPSPRTTTPTTSTTVAGAAAPPATGTAVPTRPPSPRRPPSRPRAAARPARPPGPGRPPAHRPGRRTPTATGGVPHDPDQHDRDQHDPVHQHQPDDDRDHHDRDLAPHRHRPGRPARRLLPARQPRQRHRQRRRPHRRRLLAPPQRPAVRAAGQGTVVSSRAALNAAEQREKTDRRPARCRSQNARTSVVNAQNQLATAGQRPPRRHRAPRRPRSPTPAPRSRSPSRTSTRR